MGSSESSELGAPVPRHQQDLPLRCAGKKLSNEPGKEKFSHGKHGKEHDEEYDEEECEWDHRDSFYHF